jgi:hypothetical protein
MVFIDLTATRSMRVYPPLLYFAGRLQESRIGRYEVLYREVAAAMVDHAHRFVPNFNLDWHRAQYFVGSNHGTTLR